MCICATFIGIRRIYYLAMLHLSLCLNERVVSHYLPALCLSIHVDGNIIIMWKIVNTFYAARRKICRGTANGGKLKAVLVSTCVTPAKEAYNALLPVGSWKIEDFPQNLLNQ